MKKIMDAMEDLKTVPGLYDFVMANCFIAGGAVRDCVRGVDPKDYDLFFRNDWAKNHFIQNFASATTQTHLGNYNFQVNHTIQFITLKTGTPEQIIDKFDWNVNQQFYEFNNPTSKRGLFHYTTEYLRFNCDCDYPLSAILRLPYLLEKGFKIEPSEFAFALAFVSNLGVLSSPEASAKAMFYQPSTKFNFNMHNITQRAVNSAIKKSPLGQAMSENEGNDKLTVLDLL